MNLAVISNELLFDRILDKVKRDADVTRGWCTLGPYRIPDLREDALTNQMENEYFLGMIIVQECSMAGTYWRYFIWNRDDQDEEYMTTINAAGRRMSRVGQWTMPPEFPPLTEWKHGETITTTHGRTMSTTQFNDNRFVWVVRPISDPVCVRTGMEMNR